MRQEVVISDIDLQLLQELRPPSRKNCYVTRSVSFSPAWGSGWRCGREPLVWPGGANPEYLRLRSQGSLWDPVSQPRWACQKGALPWQALKFPLYPGHSCWEVTLQGPGSWLALAAVLPGGGCWKWEPSPRMTNFYICATWAVIRRASLPSKPLF